MDESTGAADLRLELKRWERDFAAANGGRKPGRDDIRNDAAISAKYREYQTSRTKATAVQTTPKKTTRPVPAFQPNATPLRERTLNVSTTPRQRTGRQLIFAPIPEEEPTPACVRCALGPTPQKDGAVLGIFDSFPSATPSKRQVVSGSSAAPPAATVDATPSKPRSAPPSSSSPSFDPPESRTPQSSSKRYYLDAFAGTPLKRKRDAIEPYTPSTTSRQQQQFATPAFLRRSAPILTFDADDDDDDGRAGGAATRPFQRRGLVRSLSSIIQGLRRQEDDRLDDELAIMQEMEAEERGESLLPPPPPRPRVLVEDSQVPEMPLGPDRAAGEESESESDVDPGSLDANGNPRKVWKKKGLKRQTKRVTMRPVLHKPQKAAVETAGSDTEGSASDDEGEAGGDIEYGDETQPNRDGDEVRQRKGKERKSGPDAKGGGDDVAGTGNAGGKKRKVNALAHTNFRKLKIKNKNSKANGRGGRFGRR